ncbi:hypothetical protein, partial [Burkholderia pseudomallei]|uniref:hypothetical protein n=1 Tax=Burkholderia pseudomallei TaxID=28450 RepID=UPI002932AB49
PEVPCDQAIPPPDIHKIRRQVTQSFSKAPRFSAMNLYFAEGAAHAAPRAPRRIRTRRRAVNAWRVCRSSTPSRVSNARRAPGSSSLPDMFAAILAAFSESPCRRRARRRWA